MIKTVRLLVLPLELGQIRKLDRMVVIIEPTQRYIVKTNKRFDEGFAFNIVDRFVWMPAYEQPSRCTYLSSVHQSQAARQLFLLTLQGLWRAPHEPGRPDSATADDAPSARADMAGTCEILAVVPAGLTGFVVVSAVFITLSIGWPTTLHGRAPLRRQQRAIQMGHM
ncbi:hypothetical protein ACLOJK_032833 [Asimina triloba]